MLSVCRVKFFEEQLILTVCQRYVQCDGQTQTNRMTKPYEKENTLKHVHSTPNKMRIERFTVYISKRGEANKRRTLHTILCL